MLFSAVMYGRAPKNLIVSSCVATPRERLPRRGQWALDVLGAALGILFVLIMLWKGMAMSWRMGGALSPVLQISQGLVYAVIPLSALYMFVHLLARLVTLLRAGPVAETP